MDQVAEFFQKLFDVNDWPARWNCGEWSDFHGWLYIGSDITIWLAYFLIPVILIFFALKHPKIPFPPVFWLFGAFILLCGTTHILDAAIFWWPAYRVSALARFLTAVVSMGTVIVLIKDLPKALNMTIGFTDVSEKTRVMLEEKDQEINMLKKKLAELKPSDEE